MAILLDGKAEAAKVREALRSRVDALRARNIVPGLTVIQVGEDPASTIYVNSKERMCRELGMRSEVVRLPEATQGELMERIEALNADPEVHGILVQSPLPQPLDEAAILAAIDPGKDVDGFSPVSAGRLFQGLEAFVACTPLGILHMLDAAGIELAGKHAVVIGRSNIVGKPMAMLLLARNCTVTICHSRTRDLPGITRQADILVAAVGKRGFVTAEMVKPGAVVVDVGINRVEGSRKIYGDVDFSAVEPIASYITPVPGGVGPMTIVMLMQNTIASAEAAQC